MKRHLTALPMNLNASGWSGQQNQAVFLGEFAQPARLGLRASRFIFCESFLHVVLAMHHQPPEQFRQLAGQGLIGHQSAPPPFEPSVKPAQRLVHAPPHAARHHAEQPPRPVGVRAGVMTIFPMPDRLNGSHRSQRRTKRLLRASQRSQADVNR